MFNGEKRVALSPAGAKQVGGVGDESSEMNTWVRSWVDGWVGGSAVGVKASVQPCSIAPRWYQAGGYTRGVEADETAG